MPTSRMRIAKHPLVLGSGNTRSERLKPLNAVNLPVQPFIISAVFKRLVYIDLSGHYHSLGPL